MGKNTSQPWNDTPQHFLYVLHPTSNTSQLTKKFQSWFLIHTSYQAQWSQVGISSVQFLLDCVWNVMTHAQKPDFILQWNRWVHLNRQGRQFSWLLAAELCASAVVMLDTPCSEVVWTNTGYPLHSPVSPYTSLPVRRVPQHFNWTLLKNTLCTCLKHHKHITYTKTEAVNEEVHIQANSKMSMLPSTHIQALEMLHWLYSNVHYNL